MHSKVAPLALLGLATYGMSSLCTSFSAIRGAASAHSAEHGVQVGHQPLLSGKAGAGGSLTGACTLGMVAAALGLARVSRRSRCSAVPRAAAADKLLTERLAVVGTGPESIQVGKDVCSFGTLLAALKTAGLVDALSGDGPFTIFAPDDKSFAAFLAGANLTAEALLANPDLGKILKHHVVAGKVEQSSFKNTVLTTLAGTELTMKKGRMGVTVGGVLIKKPDIPAKNGVMHILSGVAMP